MPENGYEVILLCGRGTPIGEKTGTKVLSIWYQHGRIQYIGVAQECLDTVRLPGS